MKTLILDTIIEAAQLYISNFKGSVSVSVLINRKTWYYMSKEIRDVPYLSMCQAPPPPGEPWKITLYRDCTILIYSSMEIPDDTIQVLSPVSTIQIQKPHNETDKNTLS